MSQPTVHGYATHAMRLPATQARWGNALAPGVRHGVIDVGPAPAEPSIAEARVEIAEELEEDGRTHVLPARLPVAPQPSTRGTGWTVYEKIGLPARPPVHARAKKVAVSAYRAIGFGLLTMIVVALVGYVTQTVFYMVSESWMTPVALSPSDAKVVAAAASLAEQRNLRDRAAADLAETERAIAEHRSYQAELASSIEKDRDTRRRSLDHARKLVGTAASARAKLTATSGVFAADHAWRVNAQHDAGLIDDSRLLAENYQLAQISSSSLALEQRHAELSELAAKLARETDALDAVLSGGATEAGLPYEVLAVKRQLDDSRRALADALAQKTVLEASIARQDEIIRGLEASPYLRATDRTSNLALVPYENLDNAKPGTEVTACRVAMIVCRKVGVVREVLPGEVPVRHPHRDRELRGRMIELQLDDDAAASEGVLFLGGAPLLF